MTAIKDHFTDLFQGNAELHVVLQICDNSWGADVYVNSLEQDVPDRAMIKVLQVSKGEKEEEQVRTWRLSFYYCAVLNKSYVFLLLPTRLHAGVAECMCVCEYVCCFHF